MAERIHSMLPVLDEKQKRRFLAVEAKAYGWGGISRVCALSGASPNTVRRGMVELADGAVPDDPSRIRKSGGGRKSLEENMPNLDEHILQIVDESTYGDPGRVLSYTTLSLRKIRDRLLERFDEDVCFRSIGSIFKKHGYSKQCNQKLLQIGEAHPNRNQQFEYINDKAKQFIDLGLPVISVDTKKKVRP